MARDYFQGSDEPEWQGDPFARLAVVCAAKKLTLREAECLNCYVRGMSLRRTGEFLGIRSYRQVVWRHLRCAVAKLGATSPRRGTRSQWMHPVSVKTVLELIRTVDCHPRPQTYDHRGRPVTLRARVITPDDFGQHAHDWLDDLDLSLAPDLRGEREYDHEDDGEESRIDDPGNADGTGRAGSGAAVGHPSVAGSYRCGTRSTVGVDRRGTDGSHGKHGSQSAGV